MREIVIEKYLVTECEKLGALVRKTAWVGRNGCPDRLVMLPHITVWVEVKAPKQTPTPAQLREHERMRKAGQVVWVVDSKEQVDSLVKWLTFINFAPEGDGGWAEFHFNECIDRSDWLMPKKDEISNRENINPWDGLSKGKEV